MTRHGCVGINKYQQHICCDQLILIVSIDRCDLPIKQNKKKTMISSRSVIVANTGEYMIIPFMNRIKPKTIRFSHKARRFFILEDKYEDFGWFKNQYSNNFFLQICSKTDHRWHFPLAWIGKTISNKLLGLLLENSWTVYSVSNVDKTKNIELPLAWTTLVAIM